MATRTLESLVLENEDYIFSGSLIITGNVQLTNSNLIVSGNLTFDCDAQIKCGDISCGSFDARDISIVDGDIYVAGDATVGNIKSDGNIEIGGDIDAEDISCLNYLVNGDSNSYNISAMQDVYILGYNDSRDIKARDVLIGEGCDFNDSNLLAKCFECSKYVLNILSISVG